MARKAKEAPKPATPREVRLWARESGVAVGLRGRIKPEVKAAYTKATGRPVV